MLPGLLSAALGLVLASCALPITTGNLPLIKSGHWAEFGNLRAQAYVGGSLYYNPVAPSTGALVPGAVVAVRLGRIAAQGDEDNREYSDLRERAVFGALRVDTVSEDRVVLLFDLFDARGQLAGSGRLEVGAGHEGDLDKDGVDDLKYGARVRPRAGLESAVYLEFVSSEDDLTTTMFSVLPEQYPGGDYPNGLMAVNPAGRFVYAKYSRSVGRSLISGVGRGDFVLDSKTGGYQRVVAARSSVGARTLDDGELVTLEPSGSEDYRYTLDEFSSSTPEDLWNVLVPTIAETAAADPLDALARLNEILDHRDLATLLAQSAPSGMDASQRAQLEADAHTFNDEQLVAFNRRLLDAVFPLLSPPTLATENPIAEVFPLLACTIINPEAPVGDEGVARAAADLGMAKSSSDFNDQKEKIDKEWKKFVPWVTVKLSNSDLQKFWLDASTKLNPFKGFVPDRSKPEGSVIVTTVANAKKVSLLTTEDAPKSGLYWEFRKTEEGVRAGEGLLKANWSGFDPELNPLKTMGLKLGVGGYFSCTFGHVEAGVGVAAYLDFDTDFHFGTSIRNSSGATEFQLVSPYLDFPVLLKTPTPIQIGVLSLKLALEGGFTAPIKLAISGTFNTGIRAACTGLWGAKATLDFSYTVKYARVNLGWFGTYKVPVGVNIDKTDPVFAPIAEFAYFVGNDDWVMLDTTPGLVAASISAVFVPTVFLKPKVIINDILWGAFRVDLGTELGTGLYLKPIAGRDVPKIGFKAWCTPFVALSGQGGIDLQVPVIGTHIEWSSPMTPVATVELAKYKYDSLKD